MWELLRGYAGAGVGNRDGDSSIHGRHGERDLAAPLGELEGIREEVAENFVDPVLIPEDLRGKVLAVIDGEGDIALRSEHRE